ncbi:MAG TPA: DUF5684 domain-containing protein [Flavobacteriales bacterium]|nr:DUF5684 domain-containing protein [Flavobacteriales bacterium]
MELLHTIHAFFYDRFGDSMYYIFGFFFIIGIVAQWRLYDKAGQPGWAAIVPIYNMIIFLRVVGRPASHLFLFLIPVYNIYLVIKVWIETAQSFGKRSIIDYVLVVILNGLYILNLGMSYDTEYVGPVYGKHVPTDRPIKPRTSMA